MANYRVKINEKPTIPEWPYPIKYDSVKVVTTDVLVLGGGIAGCWAAIGASGNGLKITMVEKSATERSGDGGAGVDHWQGAVTNPACKISPEEFANALIENYGGWRCGITTYIKCRESYDCLLEMERMGGKIRDTEDEFKGAPFRDEKTKILFAYDYENKYTIRVWGSDFKPLLYKECKRLGVDIFDRIMVTSLITSENNGGTRVTGATGLNVRTGEFYIFKGRATVLCMSSPYFIWFSSKDIGGIETSSGDGHAIAWRAGVMFTAMEGSSSPESQSSSGFPPYGTGNPTTSSFACTMVDSKGREIPWIDRDGKIITSLPDRNKPAPGQKFFIMGGSMTPSRKLSSYNYLPPMLMLTSGEKKNQANDNKGEYRGFSLPYYSDLPSMPELERKAIFELMTAHEVKTMIPVYRTYLLNGFDPDKDMLQAYESPTSGYPRTLNRGGIVVDWNLRTNLEGLYAAGRQVFGCGGHAGAATSGRYAGRKAVQYAKSVEIVDVDPKSIEEVKERVYAPIRRMEGIGWKELNDGVCKIMQDYCGDIKNQELLTIGLRWLDELEKGEAARAFARNPHELMQVLRVKNMITTAKIIFESSFARKASNEYLGFQRQDFPEINPPEWQKWITVRLKGTIVDVGELPLNYWGDLKKNYDAHCGL